MANPYNEKCLHGPGFQIIENIERPDSSYCKAFSSYNTADISDQLNGLYTLEASIQNLVNEAKIAGPACTVKLPPGDNLMLHKALEIIRPGDILVVSSAGEHHHAVCGEMIARKAQHLGVKGIIIDGMIRDMQGLKSVNLPIWAKGVTPLAPNKMGPGEINLPVSCGNVVIQPGDVVVADCDGAVAIPRLDIELILTRLKSWQPKFNRYASKVSDGEFDLSWVNDVLAQRGYND